MEHQCHSESLTFRNEPQGGLFGEPSEMEMTVIERLKFLDWTFSATAEAVVGALLALIIVLIIFI
jgi:hypothetical protein